MAQNTQNLEQELNALKQLNEFIVYNFCDKISLAKSNMQSYIINMAYSGVPFEQCQKFTTDYYKVDEENFKQLYNHVSNQDLWAINHYANMLLREIETATGKGHEPFRLVYPQTDMRATKSAEVRSNDIQDYVVQCDAVCEFADFLTDMVEDLGHTLREYERQMNLLYAMGVPKQVVEDFTNNYAKDDVRMVKNIAAHLADDHSILEKLHVVIVDNLVKLNVKSYRSPKKILRF